MPKAIEHRMLEKDIDSRTGICAVCGPVSLKFKATRKGGPKYARCGSKPDGRSWSQFSDARKAKINARSKGYKQLYRSHLASACERCGFIPEDICQLDGHHLDHDHQNNDLSNLQTLCANCHRLIEKRYKAIGTGGQG